MNQFDVVVVISRTPYGQPQEYEVWAGNPEPRRNRTVLRNHLGTFTDANTANEFVKIAQKEKVSAT